MANEIGLETLDTTNRVLVATLVVSGGTLPSAPVFVLSGPDVGAFEIEGSQIFLRAGVSLDYEVKAAYDIFATLIPPPNFTAPPPLPIALTIANVAPALAAGQAATISELATAGQIVAQMVNTGDTDSVSYSIVGGNEAGTFSIDSATGIIRVANATAIDFETAPSFALQVRASDGTNASVETFTVSVLDVEPEDLVASAEVRANTSTASTQDFASVAALADGRYVVMWRDLSNGANWDIRGQLFNADGTKAGTELLVYSNITTPTTAGQQEQPQIAALPDGGFAVAWTDGPSGNAGGDGDQFAIHIQRYGVSGDNVSSVRETYRLNVGTAGTQERPSIATLPDGSVAVTYWDNVGGFERLLGRTITFSDGGAVAGPEYVVEAATGNITVANIAASAGGVVVSWVEHGGDFSNDSIHARLFSPDFSTPLSDAVVVTSAPEAAFAVGANDVADLGGNRFVVVWAELEASANGDGSAGAIRGQIYELSGGALVPVGAQLSVNTTTVGAQTTPSVAVLDDGTFVVTWADASGTAGTNSGTDVRGQFFNADGSKLGNELLINTTTGGNQSWPAIAAGNGGEFLVAWTDSSGSTDDILVRAFDLERVNEAPVVTPAGTLLGDRTGFGQDAAESYDTSDNLAAVQQGAAPAVVSGVLLGYESFHEGANVNDGQFGNESAWIDGNPNGWVKIDLGQETLVDSVTLSRDRLGQYSDREIGPFEIRVARSDDVYANGNTLNDATEYTTVATSPGYVYGAAGFEAPLTVSFTPTVARYIQVYLPGGGGQAIDEVVVNGTRYVAEAADGSAEELANAVSTRSGTFFFTDGDLGDAHTVSVTPLSAGYRGSLAATLIDSATGDGQGAVTWTYTVDDAALDSLGAGQRATQSWRVTVDDGRGSTSSRDVDVVLEGTGENTAPTLDAGGGRVVEDFGRYGGVATGLLVNADGQFLASGYIGTDFALARFNADGSLDQNFGTDGLTTTNINISGSEYSSASAIQGDGKIILAGSTTIGTGITNWDFGLVRYNADGSLDDSFGEAGKITTEFALNAHDNANDVAVQTDGKILVTGSTSSASSGFQFALARYNQDGSLDTAFDSDGLVTLFFGPSSSAAGLVVQSDGKILLVGDTGGVADSNVALARILPDGTLDGTFGVAGQVITPIAGNQYAQEVRVQDDGKILVLGRSSPTSGGANALLLARYNSDGSLDVDFGNGGYITAAFSTRSLAYSLDLQSDGKIIVAGQNNIDFLVARFNINGSLDTTFGVGGSLATNFDSGIGSGRDGRDLALDLVIQPDGKIVLGGTTTDTRDNNIFAFARYNIDGSLDHTFGRPIYAESGGPVVLSKFGSIYDAELAAQGHYGSSLLTLERAGGPSISDQFGATGNLVFAGGNAELSGLVIGTVSNVGGTLTITFNADATEARINEAMRSITYANTATTLSGSVEIGWTFSDGQPGGPLTAVGTTTVNLIDTNAAPTAAADTVTVAEDTFVSIPVLANDTDPDNDTLTITEVGAAQNGTASLNASEIGYSPNFNFSGTDSFSYTISDGNGGTSTATVTVTVTPVNDGGPSPGAPAQTTDEDTAITVAADQGLLANAFDPDGSPINLTAINGQPVTFGAPITLPSGATLTVNADGSYTFDPSTSALFQSLVGLDSAGNPVSYDAFSYTLSDGELETVGNLSVTVNGVTDRATAIDISATLVPESVDPGVVVGQLSVNDPDYATAQLFELLDDASGRFALDNQNRIVTSGGSALFDYETATSHRITVRYTDGDGTTLTRDIDIAVADLPNSLPPSQLIAASRTADGQIANGFNPDISADGRYVTFITNTPLVGPTTGENDVYLYDRQTGATEVVSVKSGGGEATNSAVYPSISADGNVIVFQAGDGDLVENDTNNLTDIFVRDRAANTTIRITAGIDGQGPNNAISEAVVSADGRYVAYTSIADNLVAGDTNAAWDTFVYDRTTGETEIISLVVDGQGVETAGYKPDISADGKYLLVIGSGNQIYLHDRQTGTSELASVGFDGLPSNGALGFGFTPPTLSSDGRFVAFASSATNLVDDGKIGLHIFVRDLQNDSTERLTVPASGGSLLADYVDSQTDVAISGDGRYVALRSRASSLVDGDTNNQTGSHPSDTFVFDRQSGEIRRVTVNPDGTEAETGTGSVTLVLSGDGSSVAFASTSLNLLPDNVNQQNAIIIANLGAAPANAAPVITSDGGGDTAAISVAENGTAVTIVTVTDADVPAQTLSYAIAGGADSALFQIDAATGALAFIAAPDFEAPTDAGADNIYNVTISVSDGIGGSDTQTFTVSVTDSIDSIIDGDDLANTLYGAESADLIRGFGGNDYLDGRGGSDTLLGGAGNDTLHDTSGGNQFDGGDDNDSIYSIGIGDTILGGAGDQDFAYIYRGGMIDDIELDLTLGTVQSLADGTSISGIERFELYTGSGNDSVTGGALDDLFGDAGGNNTFSGGEGNDTFRLSAVGTNAIDGGSGTDFLRLYGGSGWSIDLMLPGVQNIGNGWTLASIERIEFRGGAAHDTVNGGVLGDVIEGGAGNDTLAGGDGNDDLRGGEGDDVLDGGAGNDFVRDTDGGNDTLLGGAGNDTIYAYGAGADAINGGEGTDYVALVRTTVNLGLTLDLSQAQGASLGDGTTITGIERAEFHSGLGNDIFVGGALADFFNGGGGNDTFDGAGGQDTSYYVGYSADYSFSLNASTQSITISDLRAGSPDGTDHLTNVEIVRFRDGDYLLSELVNYSPVAGDDAASTNEGEAVTFNVLANDSDADGDVLTVSIASVTNGTVTINADNTLTYEPDLGFSGTDIIDYEISDGNGGTATAQVTVTVNQANAAPNITSSGGGDEVVISIAENGTVVTTVTATDTDVPAQTLAYAIAGGADSALFQIDAATGALAFIAAPNFENPADAGADNIYNVTVSVSDGNGGTDTQAIAVTVTDVNETPVVAAALADQTATEGASVSFVVPAGAFSDPDAGDSLTLSATGLPAWLSFDAATRTFSGTPGFADAGSAEITVTAADTAGLSVSDIFTLTIGEGTPPNAAPVITSNGGGDEALIGIAENSTVATTVIATDADTGQTLAYSIAGGEDAALFTIDAATSALSFIAAPNYEAPTDAGADNIYNVIVSVSDGTLTDTQAIAVTVTDVTGVTITGTGGANTINATTTVAGQPLPTDEEDVIFGNGGNDVINGLGGNDTIDGGAGRDTIDGGDGDDTIRYAIGQGADAVNGGAGTDTLAVTGGAANDTLDVLWNGSAITTVEGGAITDVERLTAALGGGTNRLSYAGAGTTAAVVVDLALGTATGFVSLAAVANVSGGNFADTLRGDDGANVLIGGGGNDTLFGGLGNDTLNGGAGIDTATYEDETDSFFISLIDGTARRGSAAAPVEDILTSTENLVGGSGADTLVGNSGANSIEGGDGADTIAGGRGNDLLLGGLGDDRFEFNFGDGADTVDGGEGTDTLAVAGTTGNDTLDVVYDGTSLIALEGGSLTSIEIVIALPGEGTDSLSYAGSSATVTVDFTNGSASGFVSIDSIENATGGSGDDVLVGKAGQKNVLTGGAGNDTFTVHDTVDVVSEASGGGTDTVMSIANVFTISDADVENLTFIGAGDFAGTGNGAANLIVGGNGADVLNGGGGDDTLIGGIGNDVMNGGSGNDQFIFAPNFGNDVINGFDASPDANGLQDLLRLEGFGITSDNFAARVSIEDLGSDTRVTINDSDSILLLGVSGSGINVITAQDFLF